MQVLIEHGHRNVERYTVAKLWWYVGAIGRAADRQRQALEQRDY